MIPKEFMSTDMANELAVCVQRLNDLHTRMLVLGRQVEALRLENVRTRRMIEQQRRRWQIHQRKEQQEGESCDTH